MIENISYVIVNPEDGASSLEPSQPTVVNDIVLTAQESQVYDTVLKVIKQKEILQKSMEQNYKQLMARVDQVKQFKEQQENIQKHLDEELAKEREKNRILESQLDKSKEFVGEWKENIIKQLDAIKKNIEENPVDGQFNEEEVEIGEFFNDLTRTDENHSYILVTGIKDQKDIRVKYKENIKYFTKLESLQPNSLEAIQLKKSTLELRDTWKRAENQVMDQNKVNFEEYLTLKTDHDKLLEERRSFLSLREDHDNINAKFKEEVKSNTELKSRLSEAEERLRSFTDKSFEIPVKDKEKDDLKSEIDTLKKQVSSLKADLSDTTDSYMKADEINCNLDDQINNVKKELTLLTTKNQELEVHFKESENKIEELTQELKKKDSEVEKMKRHKTAHMKRDTENTDRMDKLLGENKRLENLLKSGSNASLSSLQSNVGYDMCETATKETISGSSKPVPKARADRKSTAISSDEEALSSSLDNSSLPDDSITSDSENVTKTLREEVENLKADNETLRKHLELKSREYETLRKHLELKSREYESLETQLTKSRQDFEEEIPSASKDSGVSSSQHLEDEIENLKQSVGVIKREKDAISDEKRYIESELQKLKEELNLERQNTLNSDGEKTKKLETMETKYSELELLVKTQKNYLEHYEEQIKTEKESNQKYYQKLQAMIAQIEEMGRLRTERDALGSQVSQLHSSLTKTQKDSEQRDNNQKKEIKMLQGDIETHKYQIQVFQTDFEAERAARERQVEELNTVKEEKNKLRLLLDRMKEEEKRNEKQNFENLRRKHVGAAGGGYDPVRSSYDPVRSSYEPVRSNYDPVRSSYDSYERNPVAPGIYQQLLQQQQHYNQGPGSGVGGGDVSQNTEIAHRACPKCNNKFPDIETLEIHLMDCLDD